MKKYLIPNKNNESFAVLETGDPRMIIPDGALQLPKLYNGLDLGRFKLKKKNLVLKSEAEIEKDKIPKSQK